MKNIALILLLIFSVLLVAQPFDPPSSYYQNCSQLSGDQLKAKLHEIIKDHVVFPYFSDDQIATKDILIRADEDPDNPDNIICFYSGFSYPKNWIDMGRNENYSAFGTTIDNTWNREHVWSKSHGFPNRTKDIAYTDVHNLRPEDRTVNSSKAAKDFDWGGFPEPEVDNCFTDIDSWEPPDRVKGDVARCIFYMAVRYEGTDTPYDLEPVDFTNTQGDQYGRLSTLLEWHKLDPPDDSEKRRNHIIYSEFQKNRNPFIDHPEFAFAIWGEPQYESRISFSHSDLNFSAVEGDETQTATINVTVANHYGNHVRATIESFDHIFRLVSPTTSITLSPVNRYINQQIGIEFVPMEAGNFSTNLCFWPYGTEHEVDIHAHILPKNGKWLIDEDFSNSLGDFSHQVIEGNPRYSWHHSSWDDDSFAKLRGSYDDFSPRECWLISPPLDITKISSMQLNFRTARNKIKAPHQLQVYIVGTLPEKTIPADAVQLNPQLSPGNYDWVNSSWLSINCDDLKSDQVYLIYRYYFDGDKQGQETWELDDIKLYGVF